MGAATRVTKLIFNFHDAAYLFRMFNDIDIYLTLRHKVGCLVLLTSCQIDAILADWLTEKLCKNINFFVYLLK